MVYNANNCKVNPNKAITRATRQSSFCGMADVPRKIKFVVVVLFFRRVLIVLKCNGALLSQNVTIIEEIKNVHLAANTMLV